MAKGLMSRGADRAAAMTSFVGRRRELSDAKMQMSESRLVTLTGPGGVGKTRLALELADRSRKAFRDGICEVQLASLEEETSVASTMLAALSVPDQSTRPAPEKLADYLRERQILIVLDNCEHVLQTAAVLAAELLQEAPGLRILATSREPLGIAGERVCLIPPLSTPPLSQVHTALGLDRFESVSLLIDRARSIVPDFAVTAENCAAVAQLCNRLDGMPLAIELAAARLRSLSVTQLAERLERRFQLLIGGDRASMPRQQTLRALIDWSCQLCTPPEQLLWARLSVFPGSFDLATAEMVCGFGELDPLQIIDVMDRLVAKSIIFTERSGEQIRYRQLMTMREYGAELLAGHDDGYSTLKARQRNHYLQRAADMVATWCGPGQAEALAAMRNDHANLLSALEWSVTTPGELRPAAELASLLRYHWVAGGFLSDGRRWLERIIGQLDDATPERGAALWVAAWVSLTQSDGDAAVRYLNECHETADILKDPVLDAHASQWRALHELFNGNLDEAISLYASAIAVHEKAGDTASTLSALFQLALAQTYKGDVSQALTTCRESLELSNRYGERWTQAYSLWVTALCRWRLGQNPEARLAATEALEIQQQFMDAICTALTIDVLSWIAASESRFDTAAELACVATSVWTGLGTTIALAPHLQSDLAHSAEIVRNHVSPRRLTELSAQQARLTVKEAIAKALGVTSPVEGPDTARPRLTPREDEIARLVADGLSSRSIAQILVISPRTAEGHVENILNKLGFVSRAQIAVWVAHRTAPPLP
jgi:predicted ATPase/DNA-binding CsgD family transcriptional regulator